MQVPFDEFTKDHCKHHRWKAYRQEKKAYVFDSEKSVWHKYSIHYQSTIQPTYESADTIPIASFTPIEISTLFPESITKHGQVALTTSKSQFIGPRQNWNQYIQNKPK